MSPAKGRGAGLWESWRDRMLEIKVAVKIHLLWVLKSSRSIQVWVLELFTRSFGWGRVDVWGGVEVKSLIGWETSTGKSSTQGRATEEILAVFLWHQSHNSLLFQDFFIFFIFFLHFTVFSMICTDILSLLYNKKRGLKSIFSSL